MAILVATGGVASGSGADGALAVALVRPATPSSTTGSTLEPKIRFDLNRLNADGLQGSSNALRALHYEYCIPDRPEAIQAVATIDPTHEIQWGAPGRVGCGQGELLCLGHSHQPDYRAILQRLAALTIISEIYENFFE
ncbi:MAG: hypothetical protein ABFS45_18660 [Pseudomonadota bacterium]